MKLAEAKMLHESGAISGAKIFRTKSGDGWSLVFSTRNPVNFACELQTEKGAIRVFKSIEAAVVVLEKICLYEIVLDFKT